MHKMLPLDWSVHTSEDEDTVDGGELKNLRQCWRPGCALAASRSRAAAKIDSFHTNKQKSISA